MAKKEGTTKSSLPAFQRNLQQTIAGIADPTSYVKITGRFRSYVVLCTRPDQHHKNVGIYTAYGGWGWLGAGPKVIA